MCWVAGMIQTEMRNIFSSVTVICTPAVHRVLLNRLEAVGHSRVLVRHSLAADWGLLRWYVLPSDRYRPLAADTSFCSSTRSAAKAQLRKLGYPPRFRRWLLLRIWGNSNSSSHRSSRGTVPSDHSSCSSSSGCSSRSMNSFQRCWRNYNFK